ncbi:hypothetical protein [Oryzifoliimicrobium ureilyticus]|uniref:hypothetical protein n=1 Tax=Oryzifoliimicrobium ureilyticus TaxID=3113724 RepID=UPI0030760F92
MPRLILLVFFISVCWWLYRRFNLDAQRLSERAQRERKERQTGAVGTLVKDPVTGEYRVKRDTE